MNTVLCPTCGAPVPFRSAASVMAVCDYCKSTLVRDADSVRNIGRMSEVIEDYSPIRIDTSGTVDGRSFTVVGRIQLRYDAGFWNEWYVIDDHGEGAWLSDASGQYAFTRAVDRAQHAGLPLPAFRDLAPGAPLDLGTAPDGSRLVFIASDIRSAQCTGGQGELPFAVGTGYATHVADFRRGDQFLTLDYSVAEPPSTTATLPTPVVDALLSTSAAKAPEQFAGLPPRPPVATAGPSALPDLYRGRAVTLEEMRCQLLRDTQTITDTAGRVKGRVSNLECPSCGASIAFVPGATGHLVCGTCHATVDTSGPVAEVLQAARRVEAVRTTLPLGATGTIAAVAYTVIGLMRRAEIDEAGSEWTEYLLYAPQRGFLWLVETDEGWERASVLDVWPFWYQADTALFEGHSYRKLYDYRAVVKYAAGAFNWRVAVGDVNEITDFQFENAKLSAEANEAELTWSRSRPVPAQELATWFGKQVDVSAVPDGPPSLAGPPAGGYRRIAKWLTFLLIAVNIIPILFSPGRALLITLFAVVGLYFPAWMMDLAARQKAK